MKLLAATALITGTFCFASSLQAAQVVTSGNIDSRSGFTIDFGQFAGADAITFSTSVVPDDDIELRGLGLANSGALRASAAEVLAFIDNLPGMLSYMPAPTREEEEQRQRIGEELDALVAGGGRATFVLPGQADAGSLRLWTFGFRIPDPVRGGRSTARLATQGRLNFVGTVSDNHDRFSVNTVVVRSGLSVAVPEPESWLMLIVGFGAVGALMRKRIRFSPSQSANVGF